MATQDKCVTILPYFKVADGRMDEFKEICGRMVARASGEAKCLYYGFSFDGETAFCREGYEDAEGLLVHLQNVGELIQEALKISEIIRLEVHGPAAELTKLQGPLAQMNPRYFTLEYGFRR